MAVEDRAMRPEPGDPGMAWEPFAVPPARPEVQVPGDAAFEALMVELGAGELEQPDDGGRR